MITAYFDDSGTSSGNKVAAVGGYLATTYQWDRFILRWKSLLKEYDVNQMHRTDLETWQGEFTIARGWEPTRRNEFVRQAQGIIKRYTLVAVGSAVIKKDFEEVLPPPIIKFYGGAYGWCAHECVSAVSNWCDRAKQKEHIKWVFEKGTEGSGQIEKYFHMSSRNPRVSEMLRIGIDGCSFYAKDVLPLQAADVVAYEIFKHVQNQIVDKGKRDIRISALNLFRQIDRPYLKYWNKKRLLNWLNHPEMQGFIAMITRIANSQK